MDLVKILICFLHILSSIGFVNNLLVPTFEENNVWLLRVVYVAIHNSVNALKIIGQYLQGAKKWRE